MSQTILADVSEQIQKFWSPLFTKELREDMLLGKFVNKDYEGEIKKGGDTVYVSQINAPTGENRTVGTDADVFASQKISTTRIGIVADKRAVAAYEVEDLVDLQSQINKEDSEIRKSLQFAVEKQINDYLYSLVAPSTSNPDHSIASVSTIDADAMAAYRVLAGAAKWPKDGKWFGLFSPAYWGDFLLDDTLKSSDYVNGRPTEDANEGRKIMGFNCYEDNSRSGDYGLLFHKDFLHLVMQSQVQFKLSDLHSNKQFGYLLSVDVIYGAKLGIDGDVKHIKVYNT